MERGRLLFIPPEIGLSPAVLTVTGDADAALEAPEGAVQVEFDHFQIRLPEQIPAGPQIWHATNVAEEQPHEALVFRTPERLTLDEVDTLLRLPQDATPPPGVPSMEELIPVGFMGGISPDRSELAELDLEPGHYLAVCFVPDEETGEPHALRGMVTIFSVAAEGEEVEPPASPEPEEHD